MRIFAYLYKVQDKFYSKDTFGFVYINWKRLFLRINKPFKNPLATRSWTEIYNTGSTMATWGVP